MAHLDRNGRIITIGSKVRCILKDNMHTKWEDTMEVTNLSGRWSVTVKKLAGAYRIPVYMASHLEVVDQPSISTSLFMDADTD